MKTLTLTRKVMAGLFMAALVVPAVAASPAVAAEKWDMPAAYSGKNFITKAYVAFGETVKKESGGALEIVVHPSGSLYKGSEILRAVRSGQVPIGARYIGAHAKEEAIFGIDTVPFLATNGDEAWKLYQASKPEVDAALKKRGMKLLFTAIWPPQGLFVKKPVETIADMKGVKFRAYDAGTTRLAKLMGAVPTKTEASEIGQAFSTGVAESMIASGAIGVFRKMWDYVGYFYEVNAWLPKSVVVVNQKAWDALGDKTRKVVMDAAAAAEKTVWDAMKTTNDGYKKTMADNGIKVLEPSAQLKADFRKIGKTMSDEWAESAGETGKKAIKAYRN
jgi:TRAP-type C4-dicarboxylate transport system substrate-binding protein